MLNSKLRNQAFKLYREISLQLKPVNIPSLMRERLIHAKNRAYIRYGRRLGFDFG